VVEIKADCKTRKKRNFGRMKNKEYLENLSVHTKGIYGNI